MDKLVERIRRAVRTRGVDAIIRALQVYHEGRLFQPTEYQKPFLEAVLSRERRIAVVSSTRAGKSTSAGIAGALMASIYPNEDVVIVSLTYKQAKIIFDKIHGVFSSSPVLFPLVSRLRRDLIELRNGSRIYTLTISNPESLLGHGASTLIVDEAASIPDDVWRTRILRMVMSPRNNLDPVVILLSTPHRRNFFYEAVTSGEWKVFRWTWRDVVKAGIMKREEVEDARRSMPDNEFRAWYEAEFTPLDETFFDMSIIRGLVRKDWRRREPVHLPGMRYFAGLDVARLGGDYSALVIIEVPRGFTASQGEVEIAAYYQMRRRKLSEVIGWARNIIEEWRPEAVGVDCIGLGGGVADVLQEAFGGRVRCVQAVGRNRLEIYGLLRRVIRERRIFLPDDPAFIRQFESFEVKYSSDGKVRVVKNPRMHDDLVDALAYALYVAVKSPLRVVTDKDLLDSFMEWF